MPAFLYDSNVWVALTFDRHPFHQAARSAFLQCGKDSPAAFCRATEQSFLRLASTPALLAAYECSGLNSRDVIGFLEDFRKLPKVRFAAETSTIGDLWFRLADRQTASPKLWMDAYLAAFAISGGLRFVTFDADFRQFQASGLDLHLLGS